MLLHILRGIFMLLLIAIALSYITAGVPSDVAQGREGSTLFPFAKDAVILGVLGIGVLAIGLDILISRKSLAAISGLFLGLLAGLLIAYVFSAVIDLGVEVAAPELKEPVLAEVPCMVGGKPAVKKELVGYRDKPVVGATKLLVGVICCYFAISFVLQTKNDIRFMIPYVEFDKQTKGGRPLILDTSAIIDGRIGDLGGTKVFDNPIIIPRFVLHELQQVADSKNRLKRNRGRRGLDMVKKIQGDRAIDVTIYDTPGSRVPVDQKLVTLAEEMNAKVVTTDYNLNKVAQIRGVDVININDLANCLKSVVLPGEAMSLKIVKPGEEPGQGIGYLDDGTMVVVEGARTKIGQVVDVAVTSSLQTSAGKMIFGKFDQPGNGAAANHRRQSR